MAGGAENRPVIKMKSSESGHFYFTRKSKRNTPDRLTRRKFDPLVRKHVEYKEAK